MSTHWAESLLELWDEQQRGFLPRREERFTVILDSLEAALGDQFVVADLGCGPGSLSQRILERFPCSRVIAVDSDPVQLAIGRCALARYGDRLQWIDADLSSPSWLERLGVDQLDGAASTTALHWLTMSELMGAYSQIGRLVRPGGLFVNGDNMPFEPEQRLAEELANQRWTADLDIAFEQHSVLTYEAWWQLAEASPELQAEVTERGRRQQLRTHRVAHRSPYAAHVLGMAEAGFTQITTIWQRFDDRVALGVRSDKVRSDESL